MTTRALRVTRPRDHRHPPSPFLSQIATYNANGNCGTGGVESTSSNLGTDSNLFKQENMLVGPEFGNHTTVRWGRPTSGLVGWWVGGVVGWWGGGLVGWWVGTGRRDGTGERDGGVVSW